MNRLALVLLAIALSLALGPAMAQPSADDPPMSPAERTAWRDLIVCVTARALQGEEPSGETCPEELMRVAFAGVARGRPDADILKMTNALVERATALARCRNAIADGGQYGDSPSPQVVGQLCGWTDR